MPNDYPDWSNNYSFADTVALNAIIPALGTSFTVDTSQFSSIIISTAGGASPNVLFRVEFYSTSGFFIGLQWISSLDGALPIVIPVDFAQIIIFAPASMSGASIQVIGSNRTVPQPRSINETFAPRVFGFNGLLVAGVAVQLSAQDLLPNSTAFNGVCTIASRATAVDGSFGFQWGFQGGATLMNILKYTNAGQPVVSDFQHPLARVTWWFTPTATSGAAVNVFAWISPGTG